jgi:hypothetical protein
MGLAIFCLILGFIVGYLLRDSRQEKPKETVQKTRNVYLNYNERQREKIRYHNDADRIRQLNLLSPNESKFMRILSIVLGSVDVECPKCFSRFHHQYLPFHMSKCEG